MPFEAFFEIGKVYNRTQISNLLKSRDSSVNNGIFRPKGQDFVIIFVTMNKTKDRTQYLDLLNGENLAWEGQLSGRTDSVIINHASLGLDLVLMYRESRNASKNYGFTFMGRLLYLNHVGSKPARFTLKLIDLNGLDNPLDDREPISSRRLSGVEGKPKESLITRYERNRLLRQEAINRTGERCSVCGFSFFEEYGELGKGFVEVHHIVPLSMTRTARITDSVNDLVVVCSNCHSMLHRNNPVLLPSELSNIINKAKTKASA